LDGFIIFEYRPGRNKDCAIDFLPSHTKLRDENWRRERHGHPKWHLALKIPEVVNWYPSDCLKQVCNMPQHCATMLHDNAQVCSSATSAIPNILWAFGGFWGCTERNDNMQILCVSLAHPPFAGHPSQCTYQHQTGATRCPQATLKIHPLFLDESEKCQVIIIIITTIITTTTTTIIIIIIIENPK